MTLTGPGGTGKTRLALEIGADALERYPDGVFFVDLSALTDPALVAPTIAATLGVREVVGQPLLQTLSQFLADKRLLLVLDNCEQVLAAAPDVATLLAASPAVSRSSPPAAPHCTSAVSTSSHCSPLPLPAVDRLPPLEELAQVPAVALFVDLGLSESAGLRVDRGECHRGGRHLPAARRLAAGHRAGGGAGEGPATGRAPGSARATAAPPDRRRERPTSTATHHARRAGLEL